LNSSLGDQIFEIDPGIKPTKGCEAFERVTAKDVGLQEKWFQEAIAANPEFVVGPCRRTFVETDEEWFLWQREFAVPEVGSIDILLLSDRGRIGIVETKLGYNPGSRRSVVAQLLEYCLALQQSSPDDLPELPVDTNGQPITTREEMEEHLEQGDLLLIVAGDEIDPRATRLSQGMLGANMASPWELAMVELALFKGRSTLGGGLFLVPSLVGAVKAEVRQVVRVQVDQATDRPKVRIERVDSEQGEGRQKWSRERFVSELERSAPSPQFKDFATRFLALIESSSELSPSWGTGQTGSLTAKKNDHGLLEVFLDGRVRFRTPKFRGALGDAGADSYANELVRLFPETKGQVYGRVLPDDVVGAADHLLALLSRVAGTHIPPSA
jgi:hypothetical protein